MRKFLHIVKWDLLLLYRQNLIFVALFIAAAYTAILLYFRHLQLQELVVGLIFSDPVMLGFIFIGVLILFEKDGNILQAINVTPVKKWQYLWSKAVSLTVVALPIAIVMQYAGYSGNIQPVFMIIAVVLTSLLFVFLGVIGAVKVKTFNQYILIFPLFLMPMLLPLLDYFNVFSSNLFYLIPTHATLLLMKASVSEVTFFDMAYSIVFLVLSVVTAYFVARNTFINNILKDDNN